MHPFSKRNALILLAISLGLCALLTPACGGTGPGGAEGAGRGLVMLSFMQDGVANAVLNTRLEFRFSEAVDPATVTQASIQIREGDAFGETVPGRFVVQGATVFFEPRLASLCDESDSGLKSDTQYRVQCIGNPEEFAVRNMTPSLTSALPPILFLVVQPPLGPWLAVPLLLWTPTAAPGRGFRGSIAP